MKPASLLLARSASRRRFQALVPDVKHARCCLKVHGFFRRAHFAVTAEMRLSALRCSYPADSWLSAITRTAAKWPAAAALAVLTDCVGCAQNMHAKLSGRCVEDNCGRCLQRRLSWVRGRMQRAEFTVVSAMVLS